MAKRASFATEQKLAEVYWTETQDLFKEFQKAPNPQIASSLVRKIDMYKEHVRSMTLAFPAKKEELAFYIGYSYLFDANRILQQIDQGFVDSVLKRSYEQNQRVETKVIFGLMSNSRHKKQVKEEALPLISKALKIFDDDDTRFMRALVFHYVGDRVSALRDLEEILKNEDSEQYIEARKLKAEIEQKKDECYIATTLYGTKDAYEVSIFRKFRDKHLNSNWLGRKFVYIYYSVSPGIVRYLKNNTINGLLKAKLFTPLAQLLDKYC